MLRLVAIGDDFASVHDAIACFRDLAHFLLFCFDNLNEKVFVRDFVILYVFVYRIVTKEIALSKKFY